MPSPNSRATLCLHRAAGEVLVITGPGEGAAAGHGRLRASHADREQVIDTLKTAFADGRLDKDELDARVGQTLAARTYADLATATACISAAPAQAPPRRPDGLRANKDAVKWGLGAAGAMIPPALFAAALYGGQGLAPLGLLALPLLVIELPVVIIVVALALARQRHDRPRASRGPLPPQPEQASRAAAADTPRQSPAHHHRGSLPRSRRGSDPRSCQTRRRGQPDSGSGLICAAHS
jgi:hypothetical protein